MTAIKQRADSVLSLPTPLARLYGVALQMGIRVTDGCPQLWDARDEENFSDAAAIVSFPDIICVNPWLAGDDLRADVLAMALSVAAMMVCDESAALPGDVVAPGGFVIITRDRFREPADPVGRFATMMAQRCGRDTASAAFDCYLPVFAGDRARLGSGDWARRGSGDRGAPRIPGRVPVIRWPAPGTPRWPGCLRALCA